MKIYYGIKSGMTQVWTKSGLRVPVTIIKAEPLVVTQVKTVEADGYAAIQVGVGKHEKHVTKPIAAHLKKAHVTPRVLKEIRDVDETRTVGDAIQVADVIKVGDIVTVTGQSKGRGFSGPMKRWGFKGGPKTHGQSDRWRAPGSIGQGTTPGRVYKGKHMAGRYGGETYSVKNLQVIKIDSDNQEVWVSGPVPGSKNIILAIEVTKAGQFDGLHEAVSDKTAQNAAEVSPAGSDHAVPGEKEV